MVESMIWNSMLLSSVDGLNDRLVNTVLVIEVELKDAFQSKVIVRLVLILTELLVDIKYSTEYDDYDYKVNDRSLEYDQNQITIPINFIPD